VIRRIVIDALQVAPETTGVGRQAAEIGRQLGDLPAGLELELRCSAETAAVLAPFFPPGTTIATPIARSMPRLRRIVVQQLTGARDGPDTLLVSLGDQAPLRTRARLLAVINDLRRFDARRDGSSLERWWYRLVVPRVAERADTLATISRASAADIEARLGKRPTVIAHHPEPRVDAPAERRDDAPLLVVGALRPYKGLDTLVDALAQVPVERRPFIVVAGPGDRTSLLRRAHDAGVANSLDVLGWVDEPTLERLYADARALVAPSRHEGYGLPVAEALARALPVLASAIAPHVEVGGDAILTFEPGDAASLAVGLEQLDDAAVRNRLAAAGLARSQELAAERPRWREVILDAAQ
jgi:glycosyltransferase involved in cell wall biosynthesis